MSAFHEEAARGEERAQPFAPFALKLDRAVLQGAAGAERFLEVLREVFEELGVPGEAVEDGHGLSISSLRLDAELHGDPGRDLFLHLRRAFAVVRRPAARGANGADGGGIDESDGVPAHDLRIIPPWPIRSRSLPVSR